MPLAAGNTCCAPEPPPENQFFLVATQASGRVQQPAAGILLRLLGAAVSDGVAIDTRRDALFVAGSSGAAAVEGRLSVGRWIGFSCKWPYVSSWPMLEVIRSLQAGVW